MTYIDDPTRTPAENSAAAVEQRRDLFTLRHTSPPIDTVPPIPLSRYDSCSCGQPRLMHGTWSDHDFDLAEACDYASIADDPELRLLYDLGFLS